jgi:hypothetical protein
MIVAMVLIGVGIAVEVIFDRSVFEYIALGLGKIGFDVGAATYRNVKTDTPIRVQEATVTQAIRAVENNVPVSGVNLGLQTWKPPEGESK